MPPVPRLVKERYVHFKLIRKVKRKEVPDGSTWNKQRNGYLPYTLDRYGCHSALLKKRRLRNPHARFHPYIVSAPELRSLFGWCPGDGEGGEDAVFPGDLPWQRLTLQKES